MRKQYAGVRKGSCQLFDARRGVDVVIRYAVSVKDSAEQKRHEDVEFLAQGIERIQAFVINQPGGRGETGFHIDARAGTVDDTGSDLLQRFGKAVFHGGVRQSR